MVGIEKGNALVLERTTTQARNQEEEEPAAGDRRWKVSLLQHHRTCPCTQQLGPISYLLGTWKGQGEGGFPTINSFSYVEQLNFSHSGKPFIAYTQKTWKLNSGEPMHAESGFWRPKPDGSIEVVISQSTGLVEVQKGTYDAEEKVIKLQSELVGNASKVKEITRVFKLVDEELSYEVQMATNLTSLQPHLKASLKRI
ncbi:fatty acid-binding-like protein [Pyrus ussuriensis x Pyrus communis]|uniref:Fatty acid-binding-like protein n=1 Tax=Pyrus ussuriensis x Pyrus communis TaxID=2448454 RepID=A0A5N5I5Y5_9ROSA|nr:fatty acid-binding-like protein [Pyrus ussuriensis x Pyrus communis]